MSEPKAPFCYENREGSSYHWELGCSSVPEDLASNPEWVVTKEKPRDRQPCEECRAK